MVEKELKKLSRRELLEILIVQTKRVERLEAQLAEAQKVIADRRIMVDRIGNLAEACLAVNGVFEAAQKAAAQYLENVEIIAKQAATPDEFENPFVQKETDHTKETVEQTEEVSLENLSRKERRELKREEKKAAREAKKQEKLLKKEQKKKNRE